MNFGDARMARAREMSGYVAKTFGVLMAGSFLGSFDRLILGKVGSSANFSYYTVATNFGSRIQNLSQSIMGPVFHQTSRAVGRNNRASAAAVYNETFDFTFGWYVLTSVWAVCWYPVFLRLWLGADLAAGVAPAFAPLVVAFCLSAVANISSAQLGPLNRMGVELGFTIVGGLFRGVCALAGWHWGGFSGLVWGVLFSRVVTFIQDVYVIRLVGGGGWLAAKTWWHLLGQCLVGAGFATAYLLFPRDSLWLAVPAGLHGIAVAAWLARKYMKRGVMYFLDIPVLRIALRQK
jgi:O-antigen/teichoic acid export membrane protein